MIDLDEIEAHLDEGGKLNGFNAVDLYRVAKRYEDALLKIVDSAREKRISKLAGEAVFGDDR